MAKVHVIGAGLAGLSAALELAEPGISVSLYEAAQAAGGRCRSYYDARLDAIIDNGNHLLLSGNRAALAYLERIGTRGTLSGPAAPVLPFADLASGERWTLELGSFRAILGRGGGVPGIGPRDYLAALALIGAGPKTRIGDRLDDNTLGFRRLWRPMLVAGLNTEPRDASARLAWTLLTKTLARGAGACRPLIIQGGLSAAFVDPALTLLEARGTTVAFGRRLQGMQSDGDFIRVLMFGDDAVELARDDAVVLAVPPTSAADLIPGLKAPDAFSAILNIHFKTAPMADLPPMLGMLNSISEWLFSYPDRLSVTISAADRLLDMPREELAELVWMEICSVSGETHPLPVWQVIKERRATFLATPEQQARRPQARMQYRNLVLAGDWIDTGLPATIEGAIQSGVAAARLIRRIGSGKDQPRHEPAL